LAIRSLEEMNIDIGVSCFASATMNVIRVKVSTKCGLYSTRLLYASLSWVTFYKHQIQMVFISTV
jgi:hypothetical protein